MEAQIRIAAFKWLEQQTALHGDVLPYKLLHQGFEYQGERVTVIGQQGIWKPRQFHLIPISITTSINGPYDDYPDETGLTIYRYRGTDPNHRDNVGLREAMRQNVPLIYFSGVSTGKYFASWPVFVVNDNPANLSFSITFDDHRSADLYTRQFSNTNSPNLFDQYMILEEAAYRRQYATSTVRTRLHQSSFRIRVLEAYREQCTFCMLKHPELLDAAHIIPDSNPRGVPSVTNGLSLCKIHHAAFDRNIIGVTPEYQIMVREEVLKEVDGPMLKHGIQQLHEQKLVLPHRKALWPDQEKLQERYYDFVNII